MKALIIAAALMSMSVSAKPFYSTSYIDYELLGDKQSVTVGACQLFSAISGQKIDEWRDLVGKMSDGAAIHAGFSYGLGLLDAWSVSNKEEKKESAKLFYKLHQCRELYKLVKGEMI